ncbi:hypothetical protein EJ06DRAFT_579746 [Trichodelitschia bisporula]|uniref:Uncharacterized protein n=1 Tax=Trichodelitschia bisporula TaxID=703511 RepID=A0A6G1I6C3_9PEZI|nr:hypothetical protein EJ06DRAFT_579746 [Trichodelitschia bisporula]
MATDADPVLLVPIKLDACVINPSVCGDFPNSTLAPLSQPNFTFLRTDSSLISPDVLPYHDLHNASPASVNPRLTNLATSLPIPERQGVYLHWMLPRTYRSGTASDANDSTHDLRAPVFKNSPDRWLVIRRLHPGFKPEDAVRQGKVKEITAWVIESNRLRNIQEFDRNVDIELECSPFIQADASAPSLDGQAEIFIGNKVELEQWTEQLGTQPNQFVQLNVIGAANPLFADYAPHNSNVFSMFDNFGTNLTDATVSYYVVGWHANSRDDPLSNLDESALLSSILRDLKMELKLSKTDDTKVDIDARKHSRVLCHGALYTVRFNNSALPTDVKVPANDAGLKFGDKSSHPVTVGTTALDAVLSYVKAHHEETKTQSTPSDKELDKTEADILLLDTLLLKQEDEIDAQQEALDMLSANNFQPAKDSGTHWHFSAADAAPMDSKLPNRTAKNFSPNDDQKQVLADLNAAQEVCDVATRELQSERWALFALWWQYVADPALQDIKNRDTLVSKLRGQVDLVERLLKIQGRFKKLVDTCLVPFGSDEDTRIVQPGSQTRFYTQKDPTILVPGVTNPWPVDWISTLQARLSPQVKPNKLPDNLPNGWSGLQDISSKQVPKRMPAALQRGIQTLCSEFFNLHPKDTTGDTWSPISEGTLPLYHDFVEDNIVKEGLKGGTGRDQWNSAQPWFPLFLEWEARYYHIPWEKWGFMEIDANPAPGKVKRWRWGINEGDTIQGLADDTVTKDVDERVISGRVLILPQPGFSLRVNIQQIFSSTSRDDLPSDLKFDPTRVSGSGNQKSAADQDKQIRDQFLSRVERLNYLSAPLAGFQDHLVTKLNGTHLKPSYRVPKKPLVPFKAAVEAGKMGTSLTEAEIGHWISLMDIETDKVPFTNHVPFPDRQIAPLKPVCHGQFKFTRLDVFDKFGQAISAINPAPTNAVPPLYPVLSEYFHPQHLSTDPASEGYLQAKSVGKDPFGSCQFGQYPPIINQDTRINTAFMHWDEKAGVSGLWRPCTEWENPIWGYLVVNYAEYAMQVFLPDGQFYREIRMGGPTGTTEKPAWAPFEQPKEGLEKVTGSPTEAQALVQLDNLLSRFKDLSYLQNFFRMINKSLDSIAHTPNSYADYLSSIVGRPLAIANMGYSIELAQPPFKNQCTLPTDADVSKPLESYDFKLKLGDRDRVYDGLVGYFDSSADFEHFGTELNLDTVYTYYPTDEAPTAEIQPANYLHAQPYHFSTADASRTTAAAATDPNMTDATAQAAAAAFTEVHWRKMKLAGVIFDPFSKLHVYSGILPIATLQLPQWSLQAAMQSMTAFFSMGPLLITTPDLQRQYNPKRNLTKEINLLALEEVEKADEDADKDKDGKKDEKTDEKKVDPAQPVPFKGIPIPAIQSAEWNWLQPFARDIVAPTDGGAGDAGAVAGSGTTVPKKETHWNPFVITHLDNKPKFEKGPYTAIEGYLQLKRPIMQPLAKQ